MPSIVPTISAELLSQYCFASAIRRARIIDMMRDEEFQPFKDWYPEVRGAYSRYLATQCSDEQPLRSLETLLIQRQARTDDEESKILKQLEAIEKILETSHKQLLSQGRLEPVGQNPKYFEVSGTRVRVNPAAIIFSTELGRKEPIVGVVKPYWKSSSPLSSKRARMFTGILHWYSAESLAHLGHANANLTWVREVFSKRSFKASSATIRLRNELMAACDEIFQRWNVITSETESKSKHDGM